MESNDELGADIVGTVLDIPLGDATFDSIICTEVIEHVRDPQAAINELHRVGKSGGLLYLTAPMHWGLHYEPYDYFRFTKYGLASMLERAGFQVLETRQIGGLFAVISGRLSDLVVNLLYRIGFPLKFIVGNRLRISILSLIAFPFVVLGDLLAALADAVIPGSRKDALGWVILAENVGEPPEK